jgi:hypothetical protein
MKPVEERRGFAILLEAPPSKKSLWAAVVRAAEHPLGMARGVKVCLGCSREKVLADARAFVDEATARDDQPKNL